MKLTFRRSAHAFTLTEVPAAMGLIFATGSNFIAGLAVGTAVAMLLARLPAIKAVCNIGQYVLAHAVGFVVLRAIAGEAPEFGPLTWVGTFVVMQLGGILSIVAITTAMTLAEGRPTFAEIRQMFRLDAVVTPANTSLALLAAVVVVPAGRGADHDRAARRRGDRLPRVCQRARAQREGRVPLRGESHAVALAGARRRD